MSDTTRYIEYLPTFKVGHDGAGREFVQCRYAGYDWYLAAEQFRFPDQTPYGYFDRSLPREVNLDLRLVEIPKLPPDLTIPDNIVLGEN